MIGNDALRGQVALVTGASRGIGRGIAEILAEHGADVALTGRSAEKLEEAAAAIRRLGRQAAVLPADLMDPAQAAALPGRAADALGRLDILVNNAGLGVYGPLEDFDPEAWDAIFAANARAPFLLCQAAIPLLRRQPVSFIVNISSVVGKKGYAEQAAYGASKHAILGLSKALGKEVQKDNIRVVAVCPGGVDTEMVREARPDLEVSGLIQIREVAEAVLFLVTRRGNGVTDCLDLRRAGGTPWA